MVTELFALMVQYGYWHSIGRPVVIDPPGVPGPVAGAYVGIMGSRLPPFFLG